MWNEPSKLLTNNLNKEPNHMAQNVEAQVTNSSPFDSFYTKLTFLIPPMRYYE